MDICRATTTPNTEWSFCPSIAPSILFIVLFALTFFIHVGQAVYYRKPYSWIIIMAALWQMLTYIFRTLSIQNPGSYGDYAAWFVLILVAPLWTNAYVYTLFGRMVWNYTSTHQLGRVFKLGSLELSLLFWILSRLLSKWQAQSKQLALMQPTSRFWTACTYIWAELAFNWVLFLFSAYMQRDYFMKFDKIQMQDKPLSYFMFKS
jgi:hypothetical protein